MNRTTTDLAWVVVIGIAIFVVGCSTPAPRDLVLSHDVKLDQPRDDRYDLPPIRITRDEDAGVVTFAGEVRRRDSDNVPQTDEHLHIDILDAKGEWIDQIALHWLPQTIPTTGDRTATYEVSYFWKPPTGTTIRLSVADDSHDTLLGSGGGSSGGAGIPSAPGQPKGINTPSPGGTPRRGATRTPGQPRQPSQPRTPGTPNTGRGHR